MGFEGVWSLFGCMFLGFLVIYYSFSWVMYGVLGLPLKNRAFQAAGKVQDSSMPIVIFIGFAVYIYFKDVETN